MRWKHYYLVLGLATIAAVTVTRVPRAPAGTTAGAVANYGYMEATVEGQRPMALPLRHTAVRAEVVGVMSAVRVTQHFHNPYPRPITATYVFPLPHRAAIHGMTMRLGQRVVRAVIQRREEARAAYERARRQGKTATLLEQERPNVFTQSVANIMPGERIEVELSYVEELLPEDGEYRFVFPMTVGPRYVGEAAPVGRSGGGWAGDNARVGDASRITPPLRDPSTRPGRDISVSLRINAGVPLQGLRSLTHKVSSQQPAKDMALVELDRGDRLPNRDFVVRYELAGALPQATLLASRDARGGHLLLLVQPPRRPAPAQLAPKEYVFVVDTSGSMDGDPIAQARIALKLCLGGMGADDRFQIIRFSGSAERFASTPLAVTTENVQRAVAYLDTMAAGGGTEFLPALSLALQAPRDPRRARIVVFLTDGYIGYESEVLRFVRQHLGAASLFAFGVGSSVNRYLIDGLARIGGGEPFVLLSRQNENVEIRRFFQLVSRPALTGVRVDWGGLDVREATPARVPDLFADRPIVLAARFARGGSGTVTVRGTVGGQPFAQQLPVVLPDAAAPGASPALGYLWARRRISEWLDRHDQEEDARPALQRSVTELALRYSLLSKWTSFVAVDELVRNPGGPSGFTPLGGGGHAAAPNPKGAADDATVPAELPEGVGRRAAPPGAFVRAALSQDQFVPGDPEVRVAAPPDARAVTLLFPTGEVKACARDPRSGEWVASFLIPEGTADGVYAIRVLITRYSGEQLERVVRYQVDGAAPRVRLTLAASVVRPGERVELRALPAPLDAPPLHLAADGRDVGDPTFAARVSEEIKTAQALLPDGLARDLTRAPDGGFALTFVAPAAPGRYPVVVVARDGARNKTRQVLWLTVIAPSP